MPNIGSVWSFAIPNHSAIFRSVVVKVECLFVPFYLLNSFSKVIEIIFIQCFYFYLFVCDVVYSASSVII